MKTNDLTQGDIYSQLIRLSLPLMGTALIQMSYNLMDMFWLGKLSTQSLAATAAVGYISWLAMAFVLMIRTGAEIGVGQSVGAKKTAQRRGRGIGYRSHHSQRSRRSLRGIGHTGPVGRRRG